MKKRAILVCLCLLMSAPVVFAEQEPTIETEVSTSVLAKDDFSPQLLEKIKLQRNTIYNALNLTPCQIKQKDEIDAKRYQALETPLKNMCIARKNLKDISSKKDCKSCEVKKAQKDFDNAKKEISSISNQYDKEFKKILTSDQKAKYNMVRKLKKDDLKKLEKTQQNGQKPSDLRPFGKPISQATYSEEMKKKNSLWYKIKHRKK